MKKRTIILAVVVILLVLAVLLFPRRSSDPVSEPGTEETAGPVLTEPSAEPSPEPTPDPTPEVTDTPEMGSDEDVIIVIDDDQDVGGL